MALDAYKTLVHTWMEAWNSGDVDTIGELVTPDFVRHDPNVPEVRGPEAQRQLVGMYRAAFPDLRFTMEDVIAEGDMVTVHLVARGTHRGELFGVPPTGGQVTVEAMERYRIADGRVAEQWVVMDALGLMQQIGAIPAPS